MLFRFYVSSDMVFRISRSASDSYEFSVHSIRESELLADYKLKSGCFQIPSVTVEYLRRFG